MVVVLLLVAVDGACYFIVGGWFAGTALGGSAVSPSVLSVLLLVVLVLVLVQVVVQVAVQVLVIAIVVTGVLVLVTVVHAVVFLVGGAGKIGVGLLLMNTISRTGKCWWLVQM